MSNTCGLAAVLPFKRLIFILFFHYRRPNVPVFRAERISICLSCLFFFLASAAAAATAEISRSNCSLAPFARRHIRLFAKKVNYLIGRAEAAGAAG